MTVARDSLGLGDEPSAKRFCVEEQPFVARMYDILPDGVLQMVYAFLPKRATYLVMIQDRSLTVFLSKLKEYAKLGSTDEAIEFFWIHNTRLVGAAFLQKTSALFWASSGRSAGEKNLKKLKTSLNALRLAAKKYLALRRELLGKVDNSRGQLILSGKKEMGDFKIAEYFPVVGLLASSGKLVDLTIREQLYPWCFHGEIYALSYLTSLIRLDFQPNLDDLQPIATHVNLQYLNLSDRQVKDCQFLSSLVQLKYLRFGMNLGTDLNSLASLKNLRTLFLTVWKEGKYDSLGGYVSMLILPCFPPALAVCLDVSDIC